MTSGALNVASFGNRERAVQVFFNCSYRLNPITDCPLIPLRAPFMLRSCNFPCSTINFVEPRLEYQLRIIGSTFFKADSYQLEVLFTALASAYFLS